MARNSGTLALLLATLLLAVAAPSSAQFNFFGTAGGGPRKSGLNLVLGTDDLPLITNGVVTPFIDNPEAVAAFPVPGTVVQLAFAWWSSDSGYTYNLTVTSDAPGVLPAPTFTPSGSSTPLSSGPIPQQRETLLLDFNCSGDEGKALIEANFTVSHAASGNVSVSSLYFYKECAVDSSACGACGSCIKLGQCECATSTTGSVCAVKPSTRVADTATAQWNTETVNVAVWNVFGAGSSGESPAQTAARFGEIGEYLRDSTANIVCLQEVFQTESRETLVTKLQARLPHMTRQTFGDGPSRASGLFLASQFEIIDQSFEEFSQSVATSADALTDKGIAGALLKIDADTLLYMFHTHVQAGGGGSTTKRVQLSQLRQIRSFIGRRFSDAATKYGASGISVMLVGDLNTGRPDASADSVNYEEMLDALKGSDTTRPRDLYKEKRGDVVSSSNCTEAVRSFLVAAGQTPCTLGSAIVRTGTVDFILGYEIVGGVETRRLTITTSDRIEPQSTLGNGLGGALGKDLSDHAMFTTTIDVTTSNTVTIVVTIIVLLVVIIALAVCVLSAMGKITVPMPASARVWLRQGRILLRKNLLMGIRNKRALVVQLAVPIVFLALLLLLQVALRANDRRAERIKVRLHSEPAAFPNIPRCVRGKGQDSCYTFAYTPSGIAEVDSLMAEVAADNGIPMSEVRSFKDSTTSDEWLDANRNTTQGVYHLTPTYATDGSGNRYIDSLDYIIQYNVTGFRVNRVSINNLEYLVGPMEVALDKVLVRRQYRRTRGMAEDGSDAGSDDLTLTVNTILYPHPELATVDVIGTQGPVFFLGCLMFNFVTQLGQLVGEKELHLRDSLLTMGMRNSVYWATWLVANMLWNTLTAVLLVVFGWVFQFDFFLKNDFGTYSILFLLFGWAMVPFAFFCSLFLSRARTATSLGFAIFLFGIMLQGVSALLFDSTDDTLTAVIRDILAFLPFATLAKGMADLGDFSDNDSDTGMRWADRGSYAWFTLESAYLWLIASFFTFLFIALLCDYLFVSSSGESRTRRFCLRRCHRKAGLAEPSKGGEAGVEGGEGDDQVAAEAKAVREGTTGENDVVIIKGLRKVFHKLQCCGLSRMNEGPNASFVAVKNIDIALEDKRMFCLLGHNGAGKSTTINMLTGLLAPSQGSATVFGHDIRTDLPAVRSLMGVCPQHDVLFDSLTAAEHIAMYAGLKGVPAEDIEKEVEKRLREVSLLGRRDYRVQTFSGGMKRRLSLAVSLTGDPEIVYLDEPTTGMDPVSRREVWDLLEAQKRKRLVLLTTHSMEEADVLGDRIAIMKQGAIQCIGTSLQLKRRFGSGFHVTVLVGEPQSTPTTPNGSAAAAATPAPAPAADKPEGADADADADAAQPAEAEAEAELPFVSSMAQAKLLVRETVARMIPTATLTRESGSSIDYMVPGEQIDALTQLLDEIRRLGPYCGVLDSQVGLTSLEDVFLKVTGEQQPAEIEAAAKAKAAAAAAAAAPQANAGAGAGAGSNGVAIDVAAAGTSKSIGSLNKDGRPNVTAKYRRKFNISAQLRALTVKSFLIQGRRKKTLLFQLSLPLILVLLLFVLQLAVTAFIQRNFGMEFIEGELHPPLIPAVMILPDDDFDAISDCPSGSTAPLVSDESSGVMLYSIEDGATVTMPVGAYGPPVAGTTAAIWSSGADYTGPPRSGMLGNVTRDATRMIAVKAAVRGTFQALCLTRPYIAPLQFDEVRNKIAMEDQLFDEFGSRSRAAAYVFHDLDFANGNVEYSIMYNATHSLGNDLSLLNNYIADAMARQLDVKQTAVKSKLTGVRIHPIPRTKLDFDLISIIGPNIFVFLYQLLFPVVLAGLVYEKEFKLREIQKMMGLRMDVYWIVTYLFYLLLFIVATLCFEVLAIALGFNFFIKNSFGAIFVLSIVWGNAMVAAAFMVSAFFESAKTATVVGYCSIFATGILGTAMIAPFFDSPDTADAIVGIFTAIPPFALLRGLMTFRNGVEFGGEGIGWAEVSDPDSEFGMPSVYWGLVVEWIVMLLLAAYFENVVPSSVGIKQHPCFCFQRAYWRRRRARGSCACCVKGPSTTDGDVNSSVRMFRHDSRVGRIQSEGTGVRREREAVWDGDKKDDVIRVLDLRVEYPAEKRNTPPTVAVNSLALGVPAGECFGMLGPNGSGKTSAINAMCGYRPPTDGTAVITGLDILKDVDLVHLSMGVCPQENILFEELTGWEALAFYGRLKDLKGAELDREVELRLRQMELWAARHKACGKYSGGMKRRLCVAISMMGSPAVILLDEPSTGLDPAARRTLWRVINEAKKECAMLLTTHSMEEAEALCDRVGILVNGHLHCVGPPAQLKSDIGDFLKLTVITAPEDEERVHNFVSELVPTASLLTAPLGGIRHYRVPRDYTTEGSAVGHLISALHANWHEYNISDWAVTSVTLEEVFLKITETTRRIGEVKETPQLPNGTAGQGAGAGAGAQSAV